jgi:hypothetical protein
MEVVAVTDPLVCPAGMVREEGICTERSELLSDINAPPTGAGIVKVTVTTALCPPITLVGPTVMLCSEGCGTSTPTDAVLDAPFKEAVIVARKLAETGAVATVK